MIVSGSGMANWCTSSTEPSPAKRSMSSSATVAMRSSMAATRLVEKALPTSER